MTPMSTFFPSRPPKSQLTPLSPSLVVQSSAVEVDRSLSRGKIEPVRPVQGREVDLRRKRKSRLHAVWHVVQV